MTRIITISIVRMSLGYTRPALFNLTYIKSLEAGPSGYTAGRPVH